MDPITTFLLVNGTIELNTKMKETSSGAHDSKILEKFMKKIRSKKIEQLKGKNFEKLLLGTIQEINEISDEDAERFSKEISTTVFEELEKHRDNIQTLGIEIDAKFHEILGLASWHLKRDILRLKYEFNKFVYLGNDQSSTILQFLENPNDQQKSDYDNFLEQCLTICDELVNLPLNEDEGNHDSFVKLVNLFQSKEKQFEFLYELMNIFYRLSTRTPGSMVGLNSVMDSNFSFNDFTNIELESAISRFLIVIKKKNVKLPTPFHPQLKSFEIRDHLMERLDTD